MNQIRLTPAPKRRLADILYGQLLEQIMSGSIMRGDKLPTENAICDAFGVSRPVVREALMRLQADGLVETRRGSGTFLMRTPSPEVQRLVEPADFAAYLRAFEVRMALETVSARFAAQRRSAEQLSEIKRSAYELSIAISTGQPGEALDMAFHRAVALATGNELFALQLDQLGSELTGFMALSLTLTRYGSNDRKAAVLLEHQQIVDAIEMGDGELASVYMRFHLSQARRRMTDVTRQP